MIGSIILGVVVFFLLRTVLRLFKKGKQQALEVSAIFGFALAVVNYGTIKLPAVIAVFLMLPAIFGVFYLFRFWKQEGDTIKEGALFLLTNFIVCIVMNNAAVRMHDLTSIKWVTAVFDSISTVVFIVLAGFMIADVIKFRRELGSNYVRVENRKGENDDEKSKEEKGYNIQKLVSCFWF